MTPEYRESHREEIAAYMRNYYRAHSTRTPKLPGAKRQSKTCKKCGVEKSREEFTVRQSGPRVGHLAAYCKPCTTAKFIARRNALIAMDPVKQHRIEKNSKLKKAYGITLADYEAMLVAQGGRCVICKTDDPRASGRRKYTRIDKPAFDVDHDHATGRVRGLLCSRCNRLVGLAKDSRELVVRLLSYLSEENEL